MYLVDVGPQYGRVRLCDVRESTVSLRHLAPYENGEETVDQMNCQYNANSDVICLSRDKDLHRSEVSLKTENLDPTEQTRQPNMTSCEMGGVSQDLFEPPSRRRGNREYQPPKYLKDYVSFK